MTRHLVVRLRRLSQILFLALFLYLLWATRFQGSYAGIPAGPIRLNRPVRIFLEFDPLILVGTLLSTHSIYRGLLWALAVTAGTLVLGRFFCGWVCPMGTLHHAASHLAWRGRPGAKGARNRRAGPQGIKHYVLAALLAAALVTSLQVGLLDPLCLLIRSLTTAVIPALARAARAAAAALASAGTDALAWLAGALSWAVSGWGLGLAQPRFQGAWFTGVLFAALVLANAAVPRFWCRYVCPLGALLGLLSRFSLLGLRKDPSRCTGCGECTTHCQGADGPTPGVPWRSHDCLLCCNCTDACPEGALSFGWFAPRAGTEQRPDLSRRRLILASVAGAALVPLARTSAGSVDRPDPRLIRPPGALDEPDFLARCVRCGECMKVCPTHGLQPALFEAGLEGIWTPVLVPRIGYCEYACVLCGTVCPTGAIRELDEAAKKGAKGRPPVVLGTAFLDRGRCLPWAMGRPCLVCEEHCPTDPKAIFLRREEVPVGPDRTVRLGRPYVDPARCVGCGICETRCPVSAPPAIYVTRIGESRSPRSALLLEARRGQRP